MSKLSCSPCFTLITVVPQLAMETIDPQYLHVVASVTSETRLYDPSLHAWQIIYAPSGMTDGKELRVHFCKSSLLKEVFKVP